MENQRHILLAVTGSIAAIKAAVLASDLVKAGYAVRTILTNGAEHFVTPLTFEALTSSPAATDIWNEQPGSSRMGHLELAQWADVLVVAPASASSICSLALGLAGDLLGATALACQAPLIIAPAMESAMYKHPATQLSLATLRARGAYIAGPASGRLASGAEGLGRMSEPEDIYTLVQSILQHAHDLDSRRVLVSAGPTYETIDRVRFIGNRSSGKMGYAIAIEAASRGAKVVLVSGPTTLVAPPGVERICIESAEEMRVAVIRNAPAMDAIIMAAAVADFRPVSPVDGKVHREQGLSLDLVPTTDIAAAASAAAPSAVHIGFALEAEDLVASAQLKLKRKGQDLVVANLIAPEHNPFGSDSNRVTFVFKDRIEELPEMSKHEIARKICDEVVKLL